MAVAEGRATSGGRACEAPSSSMYLAPGGDVLACCFNIARPLGNVREQRLGDIWRGHRAAALRAAVDAGRLDHGCQYCAWQEEEGARPPSRGYDHLAGRDGADGWPRRLELALSNRCNLACTMCHGELSSRIRTHREHLPPVPMAYDEAFFADLAEMLPHLDELALLGGEPTLAPEALRVLEVVAALDQPPHVNITTNAMQIPARFVQLMARLSMSFVVSIDGASPEVFERVRVGARLATVLENADRLAEHCDARGTELSFAFSLMRENWHEMADVLVLAEERGRSVYVNLVSSPLASSLHTLPLEQLDEVLAGLASRDEEVREVLDRNLGVWDEQLDRLRAHRRRAMQDRRPHAAVVVRTRAEPHPPAAGAGAAGGSPLGDLGGADRLRCDAADVVLEVGPTGFLGVAADWCLGRPALQVVHAAEVEAGGTLVLVAEEHRDAGDLRTFVVDGGLQGPRVAKVWVVPGADGGTIWYGVWQSEG